MSQNRSKSGIQYKMNSNAKADALEFNFVHGIRHLRSPRTYSLILPTRQTKQDLQSHKHAICAPPSLWISRPSLANAAHGHEPSMKRQRSKDQNFKDKNSTHPWGLRRNSTIWLVQIGLYDKISNISIMSLSSLIGSDRCQDRDTRGEWRFQ